MASPGCERRAVAAVGVLPEVAEPPLFLSVSVGFRVLYPQREMKGWLRSQFKLALGALPFAGSLSFSGHTCQPIPPVPKGEPSPGLYERAQAL